MIRLRRFPVKLGHIYCLEKEVDIVRDRGNRLDSKVHEYVVARVVKGTIVLVAHEIDPSGHVKRFLPGETHISLFA